MAKIDVSGVAVTVVKVGSEDYISLTDMAGAKENASRASDVIKNWLRTRFTIEFLGTWEIIHNPGFKVVEFDHFKKRMINPLLFRSQIKPFRAFIKRYIAIHTTAKPP